MDKQREIPPHAAPRDFVDRVKKRVEAIGVSFHDAVEKAGVSRNTGYKLLRGEGSLGSLRRIEDWLVREEAKRGPQEKLSKDEMAEWADLGRELQKLDQQRFEAMLVGLRELVAVRKREDEVLRQMFRPNPDFGK
ncbi:MAG TPA: hypothetical protein VFS06_03525 [Casimicrobiaceae bacterium]|nr:hypothetical protein [Casimicrobiaceae bacterium]